MAEIKLKSLEHAEIVVNRLARKVRKTVVGAFSPSILHISKEVGEDGLVGAMLFPCSGVVTRVVLSAKGATTKSPINISITMQSENKKTSFELAVAKELISGEYNIPVPEFGILTIKADPGSSILASLMLMPDVGNYKMENYLLDNIESAADERVRDAVDESVSSGTKEGLENA